MVTNIKDFTYGERKRFTVWCHAHNWDCTAFAVNSDHVYVIDEEGEHTFYTREEVYAWAGY